MTNSDNEELTMTTTKPKRQLSPEHLEKLKVAREKAIAKRQELAGIKKMEKQVKEKELEKKKKELKKQLEKEDYIEEPTEEVTEETNPPLPSSKPRTTIKQSEVVYHPLPNYQDEYRAKFDKMYSRIFPSF